MKRLTALLAAVTVLAGCTRTIDATPIPQPQKIDCNLIFPGPGGA